MRMKAIPRISETERSRERANPQRPPGLCAAQVSLHHAIHNHAARLELEAGLDRYTQLFDFAPIGYATLAADGTVREKDLGATTETVVRGVMSYNPDASWRVVP